MKEEKELNFYKEIIERYKSAWCPAFKGYFWGYIFFFAFLSLLFSILFEDNITLKVASTSISAYFIGIIAASSIEINLSLSTKNKASFSIYSGIFYGFGFLLLILSYKIASGWSMVPSMLGFLLALFIWVIANSDNPKLNDDAYRKEMKKYREKTNNGATEMLQILENDEN